MRSYKKYLDQNGIDEETIAAIISDSEKDRERRRLLYQSYKADEKEGPEIFNRPITSYDTLESEKVRRLDDKVNNRLNNAFDAEIVDTKVGYMFGHPISYDYDKDSPELKKLIEDFLLRSNVEDSDSEYGLLASVCGISARLAYIDKDGNERIKNLDPWKVVFIGDNIQEPDYSVYIYQEDGVNYAEFYDGTDTYFFSDGKKGFGIDDIKPHLFDYNPLYGLPNNRDHQGDAEKVYALINAYNRTLSDASNEIEQYRLAYLILKGMGASDDTIGDLKKSGVIELLGENDEVKYLTKDINDNMIENHLDRLEENIMRFAKSVNFSDESFGGNISGVAMKFKLMALENKCITMERKFVTSLRYQFKVLFSSWAKRHGFDKEDYLKVFYSFKRNLPANILDESQSTLGLKGLVSEKTRLGLLTFVDDVEFEIEEMKKEQDEADPYFNSNVEDEESGNADEEKDKTRSNNDVSETCNVCNGSGKVTSNVTGDLIQCKRCKGTGEI